MLASPKSSRAPHQTLVDAALAQRLRGNEFFKKGELTDAMREYHGVLTVLRGQSMTAVLEARVAARDSAQ